MGGWDRWDVIDSYQCVGGGTGVGIISGVAFLFVLLSFALSCPVSFFK